MEKIKKALSLAKEYVEAHIDHNNPNVEYTMFVIWQATILQNFKCLIRTTLPQGLYIELTYDGENECWYLDAYVKNENVVVQDD